MDPEYEQLFLARVYQAEAECARELKNEALQADWLYRLYALYPQLVPYTGMTANLHLHIGGNTDRAVEKRLRDCNINWVADKAIPAAEAYVNFAGTGNKKSITYYVLDARGNYIVQRQTFSYQKPEEAAVALAYRLFNIGGKEATEEE